VEYLVAREGDGFSDEVKTILAWCGGAILVVVFGVCAYKVWQNMRRPSRGTGKIASEASLRMSGCRGDRVIPQRGEKRRAEDQQADDDDAIRGDQDHAGGHVFGDLRQRVKLRRREIDGGFERGVEAFENQHAGDRSAREWPTRSRVTRSHAASRQTITAIAP
jgi:hypothetical protein